MTSIIRVGQSKFVTVPIDEDSNERILNCIQTLSGLESKSTVNEIFLTDTKAAYSKMVAAQEVRKLYLKHWARLPRSESLAEKGSGEERTGSHEGEHYSGRRSADIPPVLKEGCRRRDRCAISPILPVFSHVTHPLCIVRRRCGSCDRCWRST